MQSNKNDVLQQLATQYLSTIGDNAVDIITFAESTWGLNVNLFPVQRFILKCYYGLVLDSVSKSIIINDEVNAKILYTFTETEFMDFLIESKRTNLNEYTPGKEFRELVLCIGRRGSKCASENTDITTTVGTLTYGELHKRLCAGERIGIFTYDKNNWGKYITYDLKSEINGCMDTIKISTKFGRTEIMTDEHPYFVWRDDWREPRWVELKDVLVGDKIAVASSQEMFGKESIGENKAKLLGYLFGDGGLSGKTDVRYTTINIKTVEEIQQILDSDFPNHIIRRNKSKYGYVIITNGKKLPGCNKVVGWVRENKWNILSKHKYIPSCIKKAPKNEIACFLNRLFACDGFASIGKPDKTHKIGKSVIGITLASEKFIIEIQRELLKFGIISSFKHGQNKIKDKVFDHWSLQITQSSSIIKFADEIGIFGKEYNLLQVRELSLQKGNTKSKLSYMPRGVWNRIMEFQNDTKKSLAEIIGDTGVDAKKRIRGKYRLNKETAVICAKNMADSFLYNISSSEVLWDEVNSLNNCGKNQTIALEVIGTNIIGNDIISHNSTLSSIISNYEAYKLLRKGNPQGYYKFPAGQEIRITAVSISDEDAASLFDMIKVRGLNCDYIKSRILNQTLTYYNFQTDEDVSVYGKNKRASIRITCGGCSASSLRGKNNIVVIFDEAAYFIDNNGRFSGDEVYTALSPSVATFTNHATKKCEGKILTLSSPNNKSGIFWKLFNQSLVEQDDMLMFKMYTVMVNPTIDSDFLKMKKRQDKQSFTREYCAEFTDNITAWIEEEELRPCINKDIMQNLPTGKPNIEYFMGVDVGQKNDGIAIAIVHKENGRILLDWANVYYSASSDVWDRKDTIYKNCNEFAGHDIIPLSIIADKVKELTSKFPIMSGWFDQFSGYAFYELLKARNIESLRMEPVSEGLNMQVFQTVKTLISEKIVGIFEHPVLVPELLMLDIERSGGKFKVKAAERSGCHDDLSVAYTRAVYECYNYYIKKREFGSIGFGSDNDVAKTYHEFYRNQMQKIKSHGVNEKRTLMNLQKRGNKLRSLYR